MKKLVLLFSLVFGFSITGLCDKVTVQNTTNTTVYVHVYFNDGTDCIADNDIVICLAAFSSQVIDVPGRPYSAQVNKGCPTPDWATSSWRHNPFMGCTDTPTESVTPYDVAWGFDAMDPIPWTITIG